MKTIFRVSVFGLVAAAFMAVSAISTFAQNPCDDALEVKQVNYTIFRDGRKEMTSKTPSIEKANAGIKGGEDFLAKYGACEDAKAVADFIKAKMPELKEWVKTTGLYTRFNTSIKDGKNLNADEAYSSGKEIMAIKPDLAFDIDIVLASVGYENSIKTPPVDKYNGEAISYAKKAISDIEAGKTSGNWGALSQSLVIKDAQGKVDQVKSKQNALGWLNYMVGSIMYYNQKSTKDALPYFYQATKFESPIKSKPDVYRAIGAWYLDEILRMNKEREAKLAANENKDNDETLAMLALIKGYAERGSDAYARASNLAASSTDAAYKKSLTDKLQALYKIRFDKTDGIPTYVSTVMSKPMPDPSTPVEPVKEETPATTTSTTSSTTTTPSTTPTSTTTKPATTPTNTTTKPTDTTVKPTTDTTKPTTTVKPTSTTKPSTSKTTTKTKATTKKKG
ncbi:MAG: hypothetical protein WA584_05855 [Pyrinomonadaceae bacterium]